MRLPSGQAVARAMGVTPLDEAEILIGKAEDVEDRTAMKEVRAVNSTFSGNCPLWVYVLAEASKFGQPKVELTVRTSDGNRNVATPQLGPVGGTIVMETFAGIMMKDQNSYWNVDPKWRPEYSEADVAAGTFGLREFVAYALGRGTMDFGT